MWFTETPWPPIIGLAALATAFAAALISTQRTKFIAPILLLAAVAIIVYVVEQQVVTERERVEQSIHDVAAAFQKQDVDATLEHFSEQALLLRAAALWALTTVQVQDDLRITDVSIEMKNADSRARSHFRANGTFAVVGYGDVGHQPTRWNVDWQKEGGEWRIIYAERLDPITGEVMAIDEESVRSR
jgi:hypothetical protein